MQATSFSKYFLFFFTLLKKFQEKFLIYISYKKKMWENGKHCLELEKMEEKIQNKNSKKIYYEF